MVNARYRLPALLLLFLLYFGAAFSQKASVDFRQAANDHNSSSLGNVVWINSILQQNNAVYYEGMSVPQRIMLTGIPARTGNFHTLTFSHLASKNGKHAWDFLTSYSQAMAAANAIAGPTVLVNLNSCGPSIGPPSSMASTCATILAGPYSYNVDIPDAMGTVLSHSVASAVTNYETRFGNRTLTLYGNAAITSATLMFTGYSGSNDKMANYTLYWTSTSSSILVQFAGHLAMGVDVQGAGTGIGYGSGFGAGSISGAPFHFKLGSLNGSSLGSQDNQISGNAIRTSIACSMTGANPACAGTQNVYSFSTTLSGLSYAWSLTSNSSGASIVGSTSGQSVTVHAGNGTGGYTVNVAVSDGVQTVNCSYPVIVNGVSATASHTPIGCAGGMSTVTVSASGGVPPYTGTGTFSKPAGTHQFIVTDANGCSTTVSQTITQPPQLSASATTGAYNCGTGQTAVTITASGGTPPYTGTGSFNVGSGSHQFTVTDANGCTATTSVQVLGASYALTATATATSITCNGGMSTVTVAASGGVPPYQGTGQFTRAAGTYNFTVTDANGCTGVATVTITQPNQLQATAVVAPMTCISNTTTVTITATGGTAPYQGTGVFNRSVGNYSFTVTDANGCTTNVAAVVNAAVAPTVTAVATPITCNGTTSTVTVTATGGTPPYTGTGVFNLPAGTHTLTVTDANGCAGTANLNITQPSALVATATAPPISCTSGSTTVTVNATGGTPPYQGTGTFVRTPGTYNFTVTDANNCSSVATITVNAGGQITVSANTTPILCNGGTSTVTVTASGGAPPYVGTGVFNHTAGTYTFTVTDANNCSGSASVTITQPGTLTATATVTPMTCSASSTTVTVAATGGTAPYQGIGVFNRTPGTYSFTVTDANGCSSQVSATVTAATGPVVSAVATPILCNGGSSTVTVTATGGTPPYVGTGVFNHTAGTYTFTVTDANNCSGSAAVTITQPGTLTATATVAPMTCTASSTTVTIAATGGTPPYQGTGVFNRTPGTYSFTVTDANGCSSQVSATVNSATAPVVSAIATPILCNGGTSTVTVSATGGTPPYVGTGVFNHTAGTYTFTVTDANGCGGSASVTITQPGALVASASAPPMSCNSSTAAVTVSATGGTPPYTGVGVFQQAPGTVNYTVTDANGCTSSASATVVAAQQPTVNASATPITCFGGTSTVTVTATGGTPPYIGTGVFNHGAGSYTFTVTDANGCSGSANVTITQPPALVATAIAPPIPCNGTSTTVTVGATGGTPPYLGTGSFVRTPGTYNFTVTDANNCSSIASVTINAGGQVTVTAVATPILCAGDTSTITVTASGGAPPYVGTGVFNRTAGTYTFTVTDANNCSGSASVTITQPTPLIVLASPTPILCNGGMSTVTVTATGGTPPYQGVGVFLRPAGSHVFTVTDNNNCSAAASVNLSEPPPLVAAASGTPILCNGGSSTVTVTASGGTPPYVGTGIFSRMAGNYSFAVTDANGCTDTVDLMITQPPVLAAASSATPILCNGVPSTVTVTASGGTPPYQGTGVFNRTAGTYTFTVTDANTCSATTTITITEPPQLVAMASPTPILCNGGTSTVDVTASGGTPPYVGTGVFQRGPGTWSFIVSDANNCVDTVQITITAPPALNASALAGNILCNGGTTTVNVSATGGTPPYSGVGTLNRGAGTHTFIVTDANNCADTVSLVITEPPMLQVFVTATSIDCYGEPATVTVTATGGTPPYIGTGVFQVHAGTHTFNVTDANNCAASAQITITEPPELMALANITPILCYGGYAVIDITVMGGTAPYQGTGSFNRTPGNYQFIVTDANGCADTLDITITQPPMLYADAAFTPIDCYGGNTTITVTGMGGTPPYQGTGVFQRTAGQHSFTVTDANGCAATVTINITQPPLLVANAVATPLLCYDDTSTVTITAIGGTPPYQGTGTFTRKAGTHQFIVTDSLGCTASTWITIVEPPELMALADITPILCHGGTASIDVTGLGGTPPYSGTGTFSRGPGTYIFTVTDANGCWDTVTVVITEPPPLTADAVFTPILCAGGSSTVTVTALGGTPPYSGTGVFQRTVGTHNFTVTDFNGCQYTVTITITEPPILIAYSTATPLLCHDDISTVTVTAIGGTPPYQGIGQFYRPVGTHTFTVIDSNGCMASTQITITAPPEVVAAAQVTPILCHGGGTTITITATGGTSPYSGTGTFYRVAGIYSFTVVDANGCADTLTVQVTEPPKLFAAATATPILCNGGTSTVTVTAMGGTPPYTGIGQFVRGPGTWTFAVVDANGCIDSTSVVITEPPILTAAASAPPILCHGGTTIVTVTASGGTPPYNGTGTFLRPVGTHYFTVIDTNGCTAQAQVTITEPPALVAAATWTPIKCNGGNSTVTVTASGGTPPYTGTGTFQKTAGTHNMIVVDANGCADTVQITIVQPPPLVVSCKISDPCVNGTRTITAIVTGGTPPYTYFWMPGGYTTAVITVPCVFAGSYILQVRDANWDPTDPNAMACTGTCSVQMPDFAPGTGASKEASGISSSEYALYQNYPNPFNPSTTIAYHLPEPSKVRIHVVNTFGQTVDVLVDEERPAGENTVIWNAGGSRGRAIPSGTYFYRIHATSTVSSREFVSEKSMFLLK